MPKKFITVTKQMDRAIQSEADSRGAPYATIVREAIREWAEKRGIDINDRVRWGGIRRDSDNSEESAA